MFARQEPAWPDDENRSAMRDDGSRTSMGELIIIADSRVLVERHDASSWPSVAENFSDAAHAQSFRPGMELLSIHEDGELIGACPVLITRMVLRKPALAIVKAGPYWQWKRSPADRRLYRRCVSVLQHYYCARRNCHLAIVPSPDSEHADFYCDTLTDRGFQARRGGKDADAVLRYHFACDSRARVLGSFAFGACDRLTAVPGIGRFAGRVVGR